MNQINGPSSLAAASFAVASAQKLGRNHAEAEIFDNFSFYGGIAGGGG